MKSEQNHRGKIMGGMQKKEKGRGNDKCGILSEKH